MDTITATSVHASYGLAFFIFLLAYAATSLRRRVNGGPPALYMGRVSIWYYRPIDIVGAGMISMVFYLLAIGNAAMEGQTDAPEMSMGGLIFSIGFQFFMAGIAAVIVLRRVNILEWLGLKWKKWPLVFAIAPVTVVSMWALFAGLYEFGYMELMERLGVEAVQDSVVMFQQEENLFLLGLMAFAASIVAPLCEEVVFRGYLYPVAKKFTGPWIAALCTALIFSAAHGSLAALLPLFIFGLVLVAIYEITGSLWAPIAVHALFNTATVVVQIASRYVELPQAPGK
ncbi:CPBP family intramembrane glutamic endopeptidase [Luteolibacter algae]|uniref:CPBP family intramembrane glutamic endopeptidase n=1 Tax=Luteolibacter algae TaxID=454151 RepID=A0ABW5DDQ7_9BACT